MSAAREENADVQLGPAPLWSVLLLTFLASIGTGVFWSAVPFVAEHTYGFEKWRNLLLAGSMGALYTLGAFTAGGVVRALSRRLSPRTALALTLGVPSVFCLTPVLFDGEWALWVAAAVATYAASVMWPIVESYLTAGRHGRDMRFAIGWFNLSWTIAVAVPLLLMPLIIEESGEWVIGSLAVVNGMALLILWAWPARPAQHDDEAAIAHVSPEYPLLLRSARVLLPLSYVLLAAISPILPYRFDALGVEDVRWETPITATWMLVRVVTLALMWRAPFWHGRWGTLLLGGLAMSGGFALIVLAPTLALMIGGFGLFGVGLGITYYAALYYAMAVGRAAVEAGGVHEALIGAGYTVGPAAGLFSIAIAGSIGFGEGEWMVTIVWLIVALGAVGAIRPYLTARSRRST